MELRVRVSQEEAVGRRPETPAPAGVSGRPLRVLRWVIRDVDDLRDHLRADIGPPPRATAGSKGHQPINRIT